MKKLMNCVRFYIFELSDGSRKTRRKQLAESNSSKILGGKLVARIKNNLRQI